MKFIIPNDTSEQTNCPVCGKLMTGTRYTCRECLHDAWIDSGHDISSAEFIAYLEKCSEKFLTKIRLEKLAAI